MWYELAYIESQVQKFPTAAAESKCQILNASARAIGYYTQSAASFQNAQQKFKSFPGLKVYNRQLNGISHMAMT
jgi:hypothetical protein